MAWNDAFLKLFDACCGIYGRGERDPARFYNSAEMEFLTSIGYRPREFFDFVEDHCDEGNPSPATALLVAAVRRDYFLTVQKGVSSGARVFMWDLPTFGDAYDGMPYFPRVLAKARAKLRGELDSDVMFCCGGDRNFFRRHGGIHPADFLRQVWAARDDDSRVASWVKSCAG